ncbi:pyruvate/2-oxoglutarate dehydrogenase complex dihydrolipoamide dehydrogenase (E3) component [Chitinophaga terrae (ex Kim and Jung 2007)]|uniref:mercuric reductase n=1 Tax=Chitinophaga terrae (ex Kim and Jung 2007) TaxID=408074 RepID=UPI0027831054|nr:mercuric reductase [Chitinophaga terrae (ex Kim and Jung 2007)]MDQ0109239.1 pyruvate/2-oxoglutarate dehydrogenase complex dihydrolipoamide dehydrogenase (E3) component [Chitinophaga terrae (ex Kim and Jung 2007)]
MQKFDAIIIGSGQGGTPLAGKLAAKGWKTAIIEQRYVGGTCINDGCTPTKAMIACAEVANTVLHSNRWGVHCVGFNVDMPFVVGRKNNIVEEFRNGINTRLDETPNLTLFMGTAVFTGPKSIKVMGEELGEEHKLTAEYIFINTGTTPYIPPIKGIDKVPYLTSTTILDQVVVPKELIILGGSYVALELGQLYLRLGSSVIILEAASQLLSKEDPDVSVVIRNMLEQEGMQIHTNASATEVSKTDNSIAVTATIEGKPQTLQGTHLLVATGRKPQTAALELHKTNVLTNDKGFIQVNEKLETSAPGIYALGDVNGGPAFTHISYNDHLLVYKNLFESANLSTKDRQLPYCMFTDPQLGRIGLSEQAALKKGLPFKVAKLPMNKVARAVETGHTTGFIKALVHEYDNTILGAAIIGKEGGELVSVLQMAMLGGITATQVRDMIFAHPLYAESLNNLFMSLDQ